MLFGCAGDASFLRTAPTPTGLHVADAGLLPTDPGPLDETVAFALVRDAEQVVLRLAVVNGDSLEAGQIDAAQRGYARIGLDPVGADRTGAPRRWEAPLPPRGEGMAWLYWFEARAGGQSLSFPAEGAAAAVRVVARPFDLDFPWPAWPPLSVELPCRGDPARAWDGAEDEATMGFAPDFFEITAPIWSAASRQTVMSNSEGVQRGVGVELGGRAHFFPLAVLLHNEVSNHTLGGLRTAMTHCPLTDTAVHFDTGFDPERLPKWHDFEPAGLFNSNVSVAVRGTENPTVYNQMLGFGIQGAQAGRCLTRLPSLMIDYPTWLRLHPDTLVLQGDAATADLFDYVSRINPYREYWQSGVELRSPIARVDPRLGLKQPVLGLLVADDPVVLPIGDAPFVHHTEAAGMSVVIFHQNRAAIALERRHPVTGATLEFERNPIDWRGMPLYRDDAEDPSLWTFEGVALSGPAKGHRLPWVPSVSGFWFAWYAIHPESRVEIPGS